MFEEVRKAGAAFGFEPEADVVIDSDLDHWCDVIFGDHDLEAVRKFVIDHWDVQWLCVYILETVGDVG